MSGMDSIATLQLRLREIIDAKLIRRQACVDEIAAIDHELAQARSLLSNWTPHHTAEPVMAVIEPVAPVEPPKPKRVKREVRMHRDEAIEFIRSKDGPCHYREVLDRFGITDGRSSAMLRLWSKDGYLVNCGDGFFNVSGPVAVHIPERIEEIA